ncbi:hypothetical protein CVT25_001498 [Psilocybe cyanescens]|uniref:Uncharacterized protein n=1 Tax=Psilocybe cyanescens TaxID=93625 RepID=A0A409WNJ1_PSICY|nr:hypothetical protein CVT25_001498 [Psilocybe cyanescens]
MAIFLTATPQPMVVTPNPALILSSGIQVFPAISSQAINITTFLRSPTWVFPAQSIEQHVYSEEERRIFENDPNALLEFLEYRKEPESSLNSFFTMFVANSDVQKAMFNATIVMTKEKPHNEDLEKLVIPSWPIGCPGIIPGISYLETLVSDKVDIFYGTMKEIIEKGCVFEDGKEHPVDVLICATGFDTSYVPRFLIIGSGEIDLRDDWAEESKSYLGLAAHGFPNYLMFVGPKSPIRNTPVLVSIEAQADHMFKMINRWQTENIYSFSHKFDAVEDFVEHKDVFMKGTVTALWPGSSMHYQEAIADPRYEDWEIKYAENRFAFLGNGYSRTERDTTADWAYYIRNEDDSCHLSRGKRRKVYSMSELCTALGTLRR